VDLGGFLNEIIGSHGSNYEGYCIMECDTEWFCRILPTFWRNMLSPSAEYKKNHTKFLNGRTNIQLLSMVSCPHDVALHTLSM
jgi:hypothetical protein